MRRPQSSFLILPHPKNSPLGTQNVKIEPKIKSKSKVRNAGNIENEKSSATLVDPKTVYELYLGPKDSPYGP